MVDSIGLEKCTGCKMCGDICPNGAIVFETDNQGFWYPRIQYEKCDGCGMCEAKCPSVSPVEESARKSPEIYAAWSKKADVRTQSTSGGVFWEIATEFINNGGVVAGSKWGDDWKTAEHSVAYSANDLVQLRGSKYIQSDTANIYKKLESEVKNGKAVLFCGTPCQNAALKKYLGNLYNNVFYMDFICRNNNSPLAFKKYVEEKENDYKSKVIGVHLKDKEKGWQSLATRIIFENGQESLKDRNSDEWIKGFLRGDLYTRESCFNCHYRTLPRNIADITLGDFWGIEDESNYNMFRGISVVMVNTENGRKLLENAKENLCLRKKNIEDAIGGNPALLNNPTKNEKRNEFFELLNTTAFSDCVKRMLNEEATDDSERTMNEEYELDAEKYKKSGIIDKNLYFYLNFENENIVHNGKGKIIPYINTVINMHSTAKIIIDSDDDFEIGRNLLIGSKAESLLRLEADSVWEIKHGGYMFYGTTIELKGNARFISGYFTFNTGSVIVISKKLTFGEDVMIGRNVIIYDSDFHGLLDSEGNCVSMPLPVIIEDHVWLTSNINVNKGVRIGEGSIILSYTTITKDIPSYSLVAGQSVGKVVKSDVYWSRQPVNRFREEFQTRYTILYGYGIEGRKFYKKYKDHIKYVIDNNQKEPHVMAFNQFVTTVGKMESSKILWVIASPNHYEEIYNDIRKEYPDALIISYNEI